MAFCQKCGTQMADGAKFCPSCGTAVGSAGDENVRKVFFEGEIKKCVNCGQPLESNVFRCPNCGMEVRNATASKAAEEFNNLLKKAKTSQEYFNTIESYAVPSTREDIGYFLTMAKSNVEKKYNPDNPQEVQLHKSWVVHFNNIKNRVSLMEEKDRQEFQSIIDGTKIAKCYSTKAADAFKFAILKYTDPKQKIEIIKTYPIKPDAGNLMSLVNFISSQIELKNPVVHILKTIGLALLYIYTLGIAYFIIRKKRKENGTVDYTNQLNKAWFSRLREIEKQTDLLNDDPEVEEKIKKTIKAVKLGKTINIIIYVIAISIAIAAFMYMYYKSH